MFHLYSFQSSARCRFSLQYISLSILFKRNLPVIQTIPSAGKFIARSGPLLAFNPGHIRSIWWRWLASRSYLTHN